MKPLQPLCKLIAFTVASIFSSTPPLGSQEIGPKTTQSSTPESYRNTADGLRLLLTDLLVAAKNDDQGNLSAKIEEMEIPNYENWFTSIFGQEKGQTLASEYGKALRLSEQQFEMLWAELAKQEGEISISKIDRANRKFELAKKDDMLQNPMDEFKADWKKTDSSVGPGSQSIGYFYFVDGRFRLHSFPRQEVKILSTVKPGPVVPGKLIDRVPPVYPEAARQLRIQGMVALNVIVHKDGTVTVQNVGAGHPLLAPAAVTAVRQWKYAPTTVSGEPVDVQAKVYVVFELNKQ